MGLGEPLGLGVFITGTGTLPECQIMDFREWERCALHTGTLPYLRMASPPTTLQYR